MAVNVGVDMLLNYYNNIMLPRSRHAHARTYGHYAYHHNIRKKRHRNRRRVFKSDRVQI